MIWCGLVTPYSDIKLGQYWLRWNIVAWRHQAITWSKAHSRLLAYIPAHFTEDEKDIPTKIIIQNILLNDFSWQSISYSYSD